MPCTPFQHVNPDGTVTRGIICSRGSRAKPCQVCGLPSTKLCDADVGNGKTCDAPLCGRCTQHVGLDTDYCPKHRKEIVPCTSAFL